MSLAFFISLFNAQHVSDVNTSILRILRLIWWVISWVVLLWFDVCWCFVVVWLGLCGIRMQNNTTHAITHQISRKLLRMDVLTSETCWALNNEIIEQVTSSWSLFMQLINCVFDLYCFYPLTFKLLTHRDDFIKKKINARSFERNRRELAWINRNVAGKRLGELRNIVKSVSQDDLFVAWGCAMFILYVVYRLLGRCLKLRHKCLQFLLFIRGSYTLCFMAWLKCIAHFLTVYIECMWTGPGVSTIGMSLIAMYLQSDRH